MLPKVQLHHDPVSSREDRADWVYHRVGEYDADILRRDQAHTFAQANNWPATLAIRSARGSLIEDFSGRQYIDLHGNNCHHIGHQHPALVSALQEQLQCLAFNSRGLTNLAFVELAEKLTSLCPGVDPGLFLVPGGSAAMELALMLVRVHTGRHKTLSFDDSFHGRSLGAIGLASHALERPEQLGPLLAGSHHVPSYRPRKGDTAESAAAGSIDAIKRVMQQAGDIGCLVAEPISNGGCVPPKGYWQEVKSICESYGCLLVFDEIPMGLGKTGWLFNSEAFGVIPDITVLGKALGGCMLPAAAVIASRELDTAPDLNLGYFTHEKNPLMARAAVETLDVIQREQLVDRARRLGPGISARLRALEQRHPAFILHSFGVGMIHTLVIDCEENAKRLYRTALDRGILVNYPGYGQGIKLSFALNIESDLLEQSLERLGQSIKQCHSGRVP